MVSDEADSLTKIREKESERALLKPLSSPGNFVHFQDCALWEAISQLHSDGKYDSLRKASQVTKQVKKQTTKIIRQEDRNQELIYYLKH